MSDYKINNIYSSTPYEWQDKVTEMMADSDNSCVAIEVGKEKGKTFFCRERLLEFFKKAKKGSTALYYTPKQETATHVANTLQILMLRERKVKIERLGDILIVHDEAKDVAAYFPLTIKRMEGYLGSKIAFQEIIIDDAEFVKNQLLHNVILKAFLCDASLCMVGDDNPVTEGGVALNKSIWAWIINNPSFDVYKVITPAPIASKDGLPALAMMSVMGSCVSWSTHAA